MRESEAWREIARRVAERGRIASGLCAEVSHAFQSWGEFGEPTILTDKMTKEMSRRIAFHLRAQYGSWVLAEHQVIVSVPEAGCDERDNIRVLAALFLALECEDEGR